MCLGNISASVIPIKSVQLQVCSATIPLVLPIKLKMAPTILPTVGGNVSAAFPANILRASVSFFNHYLKALHLFEGMTEKQQAPSLFKDSCNCKCNYWEVKKITVTI